MVYSAYYIVVHHPDDPARPYANAWDPRDRRVLQAFTTPERIALAARAAKRVFVHRCGWGRVPPAIVGEAKVLSITPIDGREYLVKLEPVRTFELPPPHSPARGQSDYHAPPVGPPPTRPLWRSNGC